MNTTKNKQEAIAAIKAMLPARSLEDVWNIVKADLGEFYSGEDASGSGRKVDSQMGFIMASRGLIERTLADADAATIGPYLGAVLHAAFMMAVAYGLDLPQIVTDHFSTDWGASRRTRGGTHEDDSGASGYDPGPHLR